MGEGEGAAPAGVQGGGGQLQQQPAPPAGAWPHPPPALRPCWGQERGLLCFSTKWDGRQGGGLAPSPDKPRAIPGISKAGPRNVGGAGSTGRWERMAGCLSPPPTVRTTWGDAGTGPGSPQGSATLRRPSEGEGGGGWRVSQGACPAALSQEDGALDPWEEAAAQGAAHAHGAGGARQGQRGSTHWASGRGSSCNTATRRSGCSAGPAPSGPPCPRPPAGPGCPAAPRPRGRPGEGWSAGAARPPAHPEVPGARTPLGAQKSLGPRFQLGLCVLPGPQFTRLHNGITSRPRRTEGAGEPAPAGSGCQCPPSGAQGTQRARGGPCPLSPASGTRSPLGSNEGWLGRGRGTHQLVVLVDVLLPERVEVSRR